MQCPKCGTEITREDIIAEDAVQCPGCGAVYRRRSSSKDAPQHAIEQTAQHRERPKASSGEKELNPYRMRCRFCESEINTQITEPDGSVVCPGCGMIYRRKKAQLSHIQKKPKTTLREKRLRAVLKHNLDGIVHGILRGQGKEVMLGGI